MVISATVHRPWVYWVAPETCCAHCCLFSYLWRLETKTKSILIFFLQRQIKFFILTLKVQETRKWLGFVNLLHDWVFAWSLCWLGVWGIVKFSVKSTLPPFALAGSESNLKVVLQLLLDCHDLAFHFRTNQSLNLIFVSQHPKIFKYKMEVFEFWKTKVFSKKKCFSVFVLRARWGESYPTCLTREAGRFKKSRIFIFFVFCCFFEFQRGKQKLPPWSSCVMLAQPPKACFSRRKPPKLDLGSKKTCSRFRNSLKRWKTLFLF